MWGSNHFPIVFSMKFRSKRYRKLTNRISNYKTDWKKYKKGIKNRDKELEKEEYSRGNIEIKYRYLSDSMREEVCKASEKKVKGKKEEIDNKKKDSIVCKDKREERKKKNIIKERE